MKNKILILGLVFIMGLPSCVNFLDLEPIDGVTITKFWKNKEEVKDALMLKYKHRIHQELEEQAKKVGGHGGMDFIMDYRLIYCLQNGFA